MAHVNAISAEADIMELMDQKLIVITAGKQHCQVKLDVSLTNGMTGGAYSAAEIVQRLLSMLPALGQDMMENHARFRLIAQFIDGDRHLFEPDEVFMNHSLRLAEEESILYIVDPSTNPYTFELDEESELNVKRR